MIINFLSCVFMDSSKDSFIYIIYVRFIGRIWTVTDLNIFMQKLATFAYTQVTSHTIAIYGIYSTT